MVDLAGGKRDRYIWASLHGMIERCLGLLGWLDDPVALNLPRKPVTVPWGGVPDDEAVEPNCIVVMPEDTDFRTIEVGSNAQSGDRVFIIDIYAEDHAVGVHLRGDISAILRGELAAVGREQNTLEVIDFDSPSETVVAVMDIEDVRDDRSRGGTRPWERHWYSIMCTIEDEGGGSDG